MFGNIRATNAQWFWGYRALVFCMSCRENRSCGTFARHGRFFLPRFLTNMWQMSATLRQQAAPGRHAMNVARDELVYDKEALTL